MHNLLHDIAIAVIAATVAGLLCHLLRQPIILGYVLAGVVIGPQFGLGVVDDVHSVEIISELGLVLLLYIIGLEINLRQLISSGRQLLITSIGQYPICVILGLLVFSAFSLPYVTTSLEVLYLALLCALSSTAIVVKALYDKGELDTLPGRLTLGTLVLQDLYAIIVLAVQPNLAEPSLQPILAALGSTVVLVLFGFIVSKLVLSRLFDAIAKSPEMVVCLSLAWCAVMAATADLLHVSREMGALVAGLCISAFPYSVHVSAKTLPLRDFFLTLFFVSLGMKMTLPDGPLLVPVVLLSLFIVVSRFCSIFPLLLWSGAGRRAAFVTSLNLSQLSEFALVIGSIGLTLGHLSQNMVSLLVFTMVLLSVTSSYAIRFSHTLYLAFDGLVSRVRPERAAREQPLQSAEGIHEVVFLGYHRGARALLDTLAQQDAKLLERVLVIDFNPLSLAELRSRGVHAMFGDIGSYDTLKHAHLEHAKLIVSTIPDMLLKGTDNRTLVRMSRSLAPQALIVGTADDAAHERSLRKEGVDLVVRPFEMAGEWLASFVRQASSAAEAARAVSVEVAATGRWNIYAGDR
ncbi:MAG: cation:proton antiporter [Bdellovibrionales bacterium]|nr:cation:proton antiporter [Bdellovibrionales bacterium]